ncbi:ATP-dependent DNA helicase RecQ [Colwelliaceae bacterium 6471]
MANTLTRSLKHYFGFDQFRPGQEQVISQLISGHSSLAIFPTGSGKSLCYQLTALNLPDLTLVVSPLLALMKDQLAFLAKKGISAVSIDSTLSASENQQVMSDIRQGKVKILMVSVERFKNERFRQFINNVPISMLVVDEAHCISEWGHNFRPDYLKIPEYCQQLNINLVLLLTATATKDVKQDMVNKFAIESQHIVQTGFYRENLDLSIIPVAPAQKDQQLLANIKRLTGAGIVYVTLQQSAEQVAQFLRANNINATAYHAGFDDDYRKQIQTDFMQDKISVVVATIAFGMGIDKADIRFVIHYDLPKSIENYSQEIGRAGRDNLPANCITLANLEKLTTLENFVYGDTPDQGAIEVLLALIKEEAQLGQWDMQLLATSNTSNIKQLPLKTLLVQLELQHIVRPLYAYFAEFRIKLLQPIEDILAGFNPQRQQFLSHIFAHTQFKKVWGSLNFDTLLKNGDSDRARVVTALDYLHEQELIVLETKGMTEVFQINQEGIAQTELPENIYQYFVEKEHKEIARINALVAFFESQSCLNSQLSHYFDDKNAPERCGHCSVCRGNIAKLPPATLIPWPQDDIIVAALAEFSQHMQNKTQRTMAIENYCRFLAGMTEPIYGRHKVKQLKGFALCAGIRYQHIKEKVLALMSG